MKNVVYELWIKSTKIGTFQVASDALHMAKSLELDNIDKIAIKRVTYETWYEG